MADEYIGPLFMDSCKVGAYRQIEPKLPRKRQEVFNVLARLGKATIYDIAAAMDRPINQIVGRVSELKDQERIVIVDYRRNEQTKKENSVYAVNNQPRITPEEFKKSLGKAAKYRNKIIERGGIKFHSKLEADRWDRLKILEQAGAITDLKRQVPFELLPAFTDSEGKKVLPIMYHADFSYIEKGKKYVEDTKGVLTQVAAVKIKLFRFKYRDIIFRLIRK